MSAIQLHHNETIFSNTFLRRLQVPTDKPLDSCCQALLQLFVDLYGDKIEELIKLGERNLKEAERFLTIDVPAKDLGVSTERNPSRVLDNLRTRLDMLYAHPYILFDVIERGGKRGYAALPLLIEYNVGADGSCKLVFNPRLRFHVSKSYTMENNYGLCSLSLVKEIKEKNVYAGILYEEGCSWQNFYVKNGDPFFNWSLGELRRKFSFDLMTDLSKDGKSYKISSVKNMRVDNLIKNILIPALDVLEEFFVHGKIGFWLDMDTYFSGPKRSGRPPKDSFHFTLRKKPRVIISEGGPKDAIQLDMFDSYEEINNYTELKKEFGFVFDSKKYIADIIKEIQERETDDSTLSERVLTKVRKIRTNYEKKKTRDERRMILVKALREDFHLGNEPSNNKFSHQEKATLRRDGAEWPSDLDAKIDAMKQCYEICDKAAREMNLSQEEVLLRLDKNFRAYCKRTNKPLTGWEDATNLFFSVLDKVWLLNYSEDGNNGVNGSAGRNQSDNAEEAALRYFER